MVAEATQAEHLRSDLTRRGFRCLVFSNEYEAIEPAAGQTAGVTLLDIEESLMRSAVRELAQRMRKEMDIPVIGLVSREELTSLDSTQGIDDFVVKPWDITELVARMKRVLKQEGSLDSEGVVRCGDLVIDSTRCEVSLGGNPVVLTFKEYQLLRFLANNKEKVFTREVLLNKVWGWDYYGGDRTVDVHIRRLRSKIDDMDHSFIETIRNVGYRFTGPRT